MAGTVIVSSFSEAAAIDGAGIAEAEAIAPFQIGYAARLAIPFQISPYDNDCQRHLAEFKGDGAGAFQRPGTNGSIGALGQP